MSGANTLSRIIRLVACLIVAMVAINSASDWASGWMFPRIVLVHGDLIEGDSPIALADMAEIPYLGLMFSNSVPSAPPPEFTERPHVDLAFFWGPDWHEFVDSGGSVEQLTPEMAREASTDFPIARTGKFYPAVDDEVAMFWLHGDPFPASPSALGVLNRNGIPVSMGQD